jgi:NAD(P)-dependent dehydrogenase (short-subunit alcohol dehydrogenase family)
LTAELSKLFRLDGKIALITGASRGLGREMALAFAQAGADIVVTSRKLDACERVAAEVEALGRRALPVACHVAHWGDVNELVERTYNEFSRVDILVNNAGMSPLAPSLAETSEELFDKIVGVNLKGPFRLAAVVGGRMSASGGGSIINVSSAGALRPEPHFAVYAAAKAALNALTVAFAFEYGPNVRVNTLSPGVFLTDVAKSWPQSLREKTNGAIPRPGIPSEIVGAALYLASQASAYTTASLLRVDGGLP